MIPASPKTYRQPRDSGQRLKRRLSVALRLAATRLRLVDYLVKPLVWDTLRTCLERSAEDLCAQGRLFVRLDADTLYSKVDGSLRRGNESISLTPREQALLHLLVQHGDEWLSTERLIAALFTDFDRGSEAALKNLVRRLRHKLGPEAIANRYGVGYRLQRWPKTTT